MYKRFHSACELSSGSCEIHGKRYWLESTPRGHGACQKCAELYTAQERPESHNGAGRYDNDLDFA